MEKYLMKFEKNGKTIHQREMIYQNSISAERKSKKIRAKLYRDCKVIVTGFNDSTKDYTDLVYTEFDGKR